MATAATTHNAAAAAASPALPSLPSLHPTTHHQHRYSLSDLPMPPPQLPDSNAALQVNVHPMQIPSSSYQQAGTPPYIGSPATIASHHPTNIGGSSTPNTSSDGQPQHPYPTTNANYFFQSSPNAPQQPMQHESYSMTPMALVPPPGHYVSTGQTPVNGYAGMDHSPNGIAYGSHADGYQYQPQYPSFPSRYSPQRTSASSHSIGQYQPAVDSYYSTAGPYAQQPQPPSHYYPQMPQHYGGADQSAAYQQPRQQSNKQRNARAHAPQHTLLGFNPEKVGTGSGRKGRQNQRQQQQTSQYYNDEHNPHYVPPPASSYQSVHSYAASQGPYAPQHPSALHTLGPQPTYTDRTQSIMSHQEDAAANHKLPQLPPLPTSAHNTNLTVQVPPHRQYPPRDSSESSLEHTGKSVEPSTAGSEHGAPSSHASHNPSPSAGPEQGAFDASVASAIAAAAAAAQNSAGRSAMSPPVEERLAMHSLNIHTGRTDSARTPNSAQTPATGDSTETGKGKGRRKSKKATAAAAAAVTDDPDDDDRVDDPNEPVGQYSCEFCSRAFTRNSNLTRHKRIHGSDKRFSCMQCTKTFMEKHHLVAHERTHTGEKPYSCSVCGRGFTDRSNCARHQRTHGNLSPTSANAMVRENKPHASTLAPQAFQPRAVSDMNHQTATSTTQSQPQPTYHLTSAPSHLLPPQYPQHIVQRATSELLPPPSATSHEPNSGFRKRKTGNGESDSDATSEFEVMSPGSSKRLAASPSQSSVHAGLTSPQPIPVGELDDDIDAAVEAAINAATIANTHGNSMKSSPVQEAKEQRTDSNSTVNATTSLQAAQTSATGDASTSDSATADQPRTATNTAQNNTTADRQGFQSPVLVHTSRATRSSILLQHQLLPNASLRKSSLAMIAPFTPLRRNSTLLAEQSPMYETEAYHSHTMHNLQTPIDVRFTPSMFMDKDNKVAMDKDEEDTMPKFDVSDAGQPQHQATATQRQAIAN